MSEDQRRYKNAMTFLTQEQPGKDGMTLIELYTEKQSKYTKDLAEKNAAFNKALIDAKEATKNNAKPHDAAKEHYDRWVQEHACTWRNCVQAAYMDWVISGKKEEVDYWFFGCRSGLRFVPRRTEQGGLCVRVPHKQVADMFWLVSRKSCAGPSSRIPTARANIRR